MTLTASSMASKIEGYIDAIPMATLGTASARRQAVVVAMCQGIIEEIQLNSVLIPLTTDTGSAGAGIITGKVG